MKYKLGVFDLCCHQGVQDNDFCFVWYCPFGPVFTTTSSFDQIFLGGVIIF